MKIRTNKKILPVKDLQCLYVEEGKTDKEIGEHFGVSCSIARRRRLEAGIPTSPRWAHSHLDPELVRHLYEEEKLTDEAIGVRMGCSATTILNIRQRMGIITNRESQRLRQLDYVAIHQDYLSNYLQLKDVAEKYHVSADQLRLKWKELALETRRSRPTWEVRPLLNNQKSMEILTGTLLGDAYLSKGGVSHRLELKHASKQIEWLNWKANNLTASFEFRYSRIENVHGFTGQPQYRAISLTHPELADVYPLWYDATGRKYINSAIFQYFTPLTMAVWIMDDGSYNKHRYIIYSQSFTYEENALLVQTINERFNFHGQVKRHREHECILVFPAKDHETISKWLRQYFSRSITGMRYKWGEPSQLLMAL